MFAIPCIPGPLSVAGVLAVLPAPELVAGIVAVSLLSAGLEQPAASKRMRPAAKRGRLTTKIEESGI
jgi:hypothetical protein